MAEGEAAELCVYAGYNGDDYMAIGTAMGGIEILHQTGNSLSRQSFLSELGAILTVLAAEAAISERLNQHSVFALELHPSTPLLVTPVLSCS